ncbi:CheR family methyltransferase [Henriciella sp. AS95]|uniref:CheR family methyltransferase n=1 Tax=Henriciella sp. AS95 TaxID=3135782 RepID=UPI003177B9E5
MDDSIYREIATLALNGSGQYIPPTKSYLIETRLGPILRREQFAGVEDLLACIQARPSSPFGAEMVAALTGKTTQFFRERAAFERIVSHVLPMMAPSAPDGKLRIWCAGGGSGQEAYSLAMLLEESDNEALKDLQIEILTTDISEKMSVLARAGKFGHFDVQKGLSIHRLLANFSRLDTGEWQVSQTLANRVGVRTHNILQDCSGLGQFDVIVCCNVISGMGAQMRAKALVNLGRQLTDSGVLVLAKSETATGLVTGLEPSRDLRGAYSRDVTPNALTAAA